MDDDRARRARCSSNARSLRVGCACDDCAALVRYLLEATRLEYAMVCSSNPGSDSETSQSGVVQGHAYTLLAVATLNFNGQLHRLVKLRNPWGKVEFKGQWSDFDPNWNYVDPKEKQKLGFKNDREDGAFFIGFDVFCAEFKSITVG